MPQTSNKECFRELMLKTKNVKTYTISHQTFGNFSSQANKWYKDAANKQKTKEEKY